VRPQAAAAARSADVARYQPVLVVVSAPSGAGKTSLCEWAVAAVPNLAHSVSFTTRAPRPGEQDGRHYHFVDRTVFERMRAEGEFAECAEVHGHLYGTSRRLLEAHFAAGRDVILDIDTQGAAILKSVFPDAVLVFIALPSWDELEARLRGRHSDAEADVQRRLAVARDEVRHAGEYDYIIVNDVFERAADGLKAIIQAERLRRWRVDLKFLGA
jgi:guanylate kinase